MTETDRIEYERELFEGSLFLLLTTALVGPMGYYGER